MNPRRALFAGLAALATLSAAHAVVIGFDNIQGAQYDPYFGHTENGFEIKPALGDWMYNLADGDPLPCIAVPFFRVVPTASIEVSRSGGGCFSFQSVWLYFDHPGTYSFDGFRSGAEVFHLTRDFGDAFGTRLCKYTDQIDALSITMYQEEGRYRKLDSINVTPVPEPAAATGLALAAGCLALRRRCGRGAVENVHEKSDGSVGTNGS